MEVLDRCGRGWGIKPWGGALSHAGGVSNRAGGRYTICGGIGRLWAGVDCLRRDGKTCWPQRQLELTPGIHERRSALKDMRE